MPVGKEQREQTFIEGMQKYPSPLSEQGPSFNTKGHNELGTKNPGCGIRLLAILLLSLTISVSLGM
jgi:hypothetical protein